MRSIAPGGGLLDCKYDPHPTAFAARRQSTSPFQAEVKNTKWLACFA